MFVNYLLRLGLPAYLWITSNGSIVPFYVTIFPGFGTLIGSSPTRICLPANNDRLTSSLWIWLTRFSHRHNLKCETVRITTSFWRLQIYRRRYYSSTVLRKEWFTHPQASSHFTSCIPTEAPGLFQHTSSISYHREPATALALNCDRSLISVLYKSCRQRLSLKFRVLPTKPPFPYLVFLSMNAYPVSRFI
jgi:hypothetical protein